MPNSYVSRRSTEAQAFSTWTPPTGPLGALTDEARRRAATLTADKEALGRRAAQLTAPSLFASLKGRNVGLIAEVKRASPSRGSINPGLDLTAQVRAYERGGAAAVSVLTEPTRFGGSNEDLVDARAAVELPLLKKDFHVDPLQILEAKALGASAALVIVRAVPPATLRELVETANGIGLELLVEVRDERELELATAMGARIIGVNNRNLETLEIDPETSLRLLPLIPVDLAAVAESGMRTAADIERVGGAGADAVLVGSELSGARDPEAVVRSLTGIPRARGDRKG